MGNWSQHVTTAVLLIGKCIVRTGSVRWNSQFQNTTGKPDWQFWQCGHPAGESLDALFTSMIRNHPRFILLDSRRLWDNQLHQGCPKVIPSLADIPRLSFHWWLSQGYPFTSGYPKVIQDSMIQTTAATKKWITRLRQIVRCQATGLRSFPCRPRTASCDRRSLDRLVTQSANAAGPMQDL